ncbi:S-layer homology domain-containing protein [Paenibacillus sp. LHD-38]|uniref:S-layer homology domain-containing protein n=1 Tax=Paenibacillus sp. LHD-38 TaxID=3072143 RepID=UPI00280E48ED|nr:S-layer homology domain-containing protein [Paenibacillus sp. LHD-38]MDQ8734040.1 S-layer homology domain-containing protein [Paenibacillus sp. LHD-38]
MREKSNSLFKQNSQQPHVFRGGEIKVMKKKIAAFVLATALVIPLSVPAFAATPSDVVGKPVQSAVEELTALGVINGYEDGTFKPENDITRAELAKLIVIATGNASNAELLKSQKPNFSDVKANQWYTGYINVAEAKKLVQGFNGKFRPSEKVKFEEAVAVLVRALGYKDANLSGTWPNNVLLQANSSDLNMFKGVDITKGQAANRGVVAQLVSNTLDDKLVTYDKDQNVVVGAKTMIEQIGAVTTGVLENVALENNSTAIRVNGTLHTVAKDFVVTGGKKLSELAGRTVSVIKVGGNVVAVSDKQDAAKIATGKNKTAIDGLTDAGTITLDGVSTPYQIAPGFFFIKNGALVTVAADKDISANASVSLYLNAAGNEVSAVVVTEYSATNKLFVSYDAKTAYRAAQVTYNGGIVSVDENTVITLDGKAALATDLKKDDVLDVVASGSKAVSVEAVRKTATGKVTSTSTTGSEKAYVVNGTNYVEVSALNLVIGTEYNFILNKDNKIVSATVVTAGEGAPAYGVITKVVNDVAVLDGVQVSTKDKVEYFSLKTNAKEVAYLASTYATADSDANAIAKFTYDAAGKVTGITAAQDLAVGASADVTEISASAIKTTSLYNITASTVVVNGLDLVNNNVSIGTLANITKNDKVVIVNDSINASYIVVTKDNEATTELAKVSGLFVSKTEGVTATGSTYSVKLNVAGKEETYVVSEAAFGTAVAAKQLVTLVDSTPATLGYETLTPAVSGNNQVSDVNTTTKTFEINDVKHVATANTLYYVIDKDGVVSVAGFDAVTFAGTGVAGTQYKLAFTVTGNQVGGAFAEVGAIVITQLP